MIQINLLPQEVSGGGARAVSQPKGPQSGALLVTGILIVAFVITFGVFGFFFSQKVSAQAKVQKLQREVKELQDDKASIENEYKELRADLAALRQQDLVLRVLDPEERLYWAEKLNILPMYVPDGVFLTGLDVTEEVREVETADSRQAYNKWEKGGKKGSPPARDIRPIIRQTLQLDGVAYVPDGTSNDRFQLALSFQKRLGSESVRLPYNNEEVRIIDNMSSTIQFDPYDEAKIAGREVTKFRFYLVSRPPTARGGGAE